MGDLLVRGVDDALKVELQESARRNGRSLSDEAIAQIRLALARNNGQGTTAGQRLKSLLGSERFSEAELDEIEKVRKQPDRMPPDFG
ncbi:FitA-like ribbon-helix-helix domain-containing protein [Pararhizobium gei]|uniref:FitA-like ribbon-helix-helix domain-containing protein n=1 Tax=Pararhizobium gei TaxID=1395951 RepID=UPI0023DC2E62|nr:plasmid stabilization protein [Rhizobium gei]